MATQAGRRVRLDLLKRALRRKEKWEDKEEFLDVIYWMRQFVSILFGLVWGVVPLTGALGVFTYLGISVGLVYVYFSFYQQVDEEEYGGVWELLKEGFMTSSAIFLVLWIVTYTALHHS